MFAFMNNTRIGVRIAMALALPIIGLLVFSGSMVIDKRQTASELEDLRRLIDLAPVISALVHEMQKERGASAGFINSKGKGAFVAKLGDQRKETNPRKATVDTALSAFDAASYGPSLVAKVEAAQKAVAQLDATRGKVTNLGISVPQMAGYYTPTIARLLSIVEEMAVLSSDAGLTRTITAYTQFLQAKERAGIERAMGSGGFSAGKFSPVIYRRFVSLLAMQKTFLKTFSLYASEEQKAFLAKTVQGEAVDEVDRMRKVALDNPWSNDTQGIKGAFWFDTITKKINLLKTVEDKIAGDLDGLASSAYEAAHNTFLVVLSVTAILVVVTFALVWIIARGITGSLTAMTGAMGRLAEGELNTEVPAVNHRDEIGAMAGAVQVFKENAIKVRKMTREQEVATRRTQRKIQSEITALNNAMEDEVQGAVVTVLQRAQTMQMSAEGMAGTAEETSVRSTAVAAAAEQASTNVETVAAAAEELSSSIAEISRQVAQSSEIASTAVSEARNTNEQVQGLVDAADRIGEVLSLITDIADQTNLLALNATIEAARAGDAGKGFAVVASEVKNLANQTAKATEEISGQIGGIQTATRDSVAAIEGIGQTIGQIDEIASAIAAAVEEQGAATQEIARNVEQASAGTREVSSNITSVTQAAGETGQAATQQGTMADDVSREVKQMQDRIAEITLKSTDANLAERHTVNVAAKATVDGVESGCLLQEISRGGAAILDRAVGGERGSAFTIEVPGLGTLGGEVIAVTDVATHVRMDLDDDQMIAVDDFIKSRAAGKRATVA